MGSDADGVSGPHSVSGHAADTLITRSQVLDLAAEDKDIGENAQLTFSVVSGDQEQKFYMVSHKQEQRGTLRLKKRLDYERHSEQRFNLTLKVHGRPLTVSLSLMSFCHFCLIYAVGVDVKCIITLQEESDSSRCRV